MAKKKLYLYVGKPYQKEWQKNLHDIIFKSFKIDLKDYKYYRN